MEISYRDERSFKQHRQTVEGSSGEEKIKNPSRQNKNVRDLDEERRDE